jgi:hypothetical protein
VSATATATIQTAIQTLSNNVAYGHETSSQRTQQSRSRVGGQGDKALRRMGYETEYCGILDIQQPNFGIVLNYARLFLPETIALPARH